MKELYEGTVLEIYEDWQTETTPIGLAMLVKKKKNGLPFILEDSYISNESEKEQFHSNIFYDWKEVKKPLASYEIFNYQRWQVFILKSKNDKYKTGEEYTHNIRYSMGQFKDSNLSSFRNKMIKLQDQFEKTIDEYEPSLIDNFIIYNGIEIY